MPKDREQPIYSILIAPQTNRGSFCSILFHGFYQNHIKMSQLLWLLLWLLLLCNVIAKGQKSYTASEYMCFEMEWHLLISSARLQLIPDDFCCCCVASKPAIKYYICTCFVQNVHVWVDVVPACSFCWYCHNLSECLYFYVCVCMSLSFLSIVPNTLNSNSKRFNRKPFIHLL